MKRKLAVMAALALFAAGALDPTPGFASSHREAPRIAMYPAADNTDVYFFISPNDHGAVTLIGCWWPAEEPAGGPNYFHFDEGIDYALHIDNDGDAKEDVSYILRFKTQFTNPSTALYATGEIGSLNDADWNYRQTYRVIRVVKGEGREVVADGLVVPPVNIGPRTTPNYEALVEPTFYWLKDGSRVFAGQRDDPFFVDLGAVFDLLGFRAVPGNTGTGVDGLGGYNCQAICLEIPIERLTKDGSNPEDPADPAAVLGAWATSSLRRASLLANKSDEGEGLAFDDAASKSDASFASADGALASVAGRRQVSRLGMPLVNEVVIPIGKKDVWNGSHPKDDTQFLNFVVDPELPKLIEALYGITKPPAPRCDLVAIFLTGIPGLNQPPGVVGAEEMRLNVAIKPDENPDSRFGLLGGDLDGFPNGRRLADDVVDIEERAVAGVVYPMFCDPNFTPHPLAGQLGDGIDRNDMPFLESFPYLSTPHQGWEHEHHRVEAAHPPQKTASSADLSGALGRIAAPAAPSPGTARFEMGLSRPNPAHASSEIAFRLAKEAPVSLRVFDVSGRSVKTLVNGTLPGGAHTARWDGTDDRGDAVGAGVYLYRLETPGEQADRKVTIVR